MVSTRTSFVDDDDDDDDVGRGTPSMPAAGISG